MKRVHIAALAFVVALCTAALAQHGHVGGGIENGMGHHAMSRTSGNSASSTHGQSVDQLLSKNTKLSSKIQSLTGMSSQQACNGFKNLGQCVAAAHVSKNLGINFACMKADMTGTAAPSRASCPAGTGTKSASLGKTIQTLKPTADSKAEAKRGTQQANQDLKDSNNS